MPMKNTKTNNLESEGRSSFKILMSENFIQPTVQLITGDRSMSYDSLIKDALKAIPKQLISDFETLVVRIVDIEESRDFNNRFRGINRATNVLAFLNGCSLFSLPGHLGDILICAPLILSEAESSGLRPANHLTHLVIHGVLHLLGFDHDNEINGAIMENMEITILNQLGISNPYGEQKSSGVEQCSATFTG